MKPQLANDADLNSLIYPLIAQAKIDGVRALNLSGRFTGRSLDPFKGTGITEYFSHPDFLWLDGEITLGSDPTAENLCSNTTGAVNKFKGVTGMVNLHWWVFDYLEPAFLDHSYAFRYSKLAERVAHVDHPRIHLVPSIVCNNRAELDEQIELNFAKNYEGTITRNPKAVYKEGRPSKKLQELMRIKSFSDFEMLVTGITEGRENLNEKTTNSLGNSERSSHQENQVANGQVGSLQGTLLQDFYDPVSNKLLFKKGLSITASSGKMTIADATNYFNNPDSIIGHIAKVKTMTTGTKDKPRFPTFISLRSEQDL